MEAWITTFTAHVKLKDLRLVKRLEKIIRTLIKRPNLTIPEAFCSHSEITATYRFFDNERVTASAVRDGFCAATVEKIKDEKIVLIATDLTGINYSSHKKLKGTGPMKNWQSRGFALVTSLAITTKGTPQGLIYQKLWGRTDETGPKAREARKSLPSENRESYFWIEAVKKMGEVLSKDTTGVMVGDRGSDFYALFDYKRDKNIEILARAKVDRHLHDDDLKLFERMAFGEPDGITLVNVPRSRKTEARSVEVEIRYKKVGIAAPGEKTKKTTEPIFLYAIEAREKNAKKDTQNPILWRLLTTIPVESITDAVEKVAWYAKRWLIERYHYVLKSGCGVEELQLETAPRIEKALAVYCIVAWQILFLTYEARNNPNISCENYFTRDEWISCYIYLRKKTIPEKAPTLKEFISIIAQLGGFLGRKGDGDPGVKVIWRGLKTLNIISRSIAASKGRNVYNG